MKQIIIVELQNYHDEVIYPIAKSLLFNNVSIILYVREEVLDRSLLIKYLKTEGVIIKTIKKKSIWDLLLVFSSLLWDAIKAKHILYVTFENSLLKVFTLLLPPSIKITTVIHNINTPSSLKVLDIAANKKINRFIVLSVDLIKNLSPEYDTRKWSYFTPIYFSGLPLYPSEKEEKLIITISGLIEYSRRDYLGLIDFILASQKKNTSWLDKVKFEILGNISKADGPNFIALIKINNLEEKFQYYSGYIPYERYFQKINDSDIICPLITPAVENYNFYNKTKISDSFSFAIAFRKPLLVYKSDLNKSCFWNKFSINYTWDNLGDTIEKLIREKTKIKNQFMVEYEQSYKNELNFITQSERFLKLLD